jgi:hypothetical protein
MNDCLIPIHPPINTIYNKNNTLHEDTRVRCDKQEDDIGGVQPKLPDAKDIAPIKKNKKKKNKIEGDTPTEIINSIIYLKPNINQTRDAIRKIVEMFEEERESNLDFDL